MSCIDLHIHTAASDGTDTPRAAVEKAASLGLAAVSITDHDSVSGVPEAMRAGAELGVEVVPGIEVSSDYRDNNVHILGYFIDPAAAQLRPVLDWVKTERDERNEKIAAMFARDGFDISLAQLRKEYPDSVLGRPHFCEHLMRKGYISSVKEGFEKYLGEGKPYYLPKRRISIAKAVETIVAAGGVPVQVKVTCMRSACCVACILTCEQQPASGVASEMSSVPMSTSSPRATRWVSSAIKTAGFPSDTLMRLIRWLTCWKSGCRGTGLRRGGRCSVWCEACWYSSMYI